MLKDRSKPWAMSMSMPEEYKAVAERYETMKTQHDDMVEAEEKLAGIIEDLNSSMQKQFNEKFMQIQKEF